MHEQFNIFNSKSQKELVPVLETSSPIPFFVPVPEAAKIAGVSEAMMREAVNHRIAPIPHLEVGVKKLVRVASIGPYFDKKCIGDIDAQ